MGKKRTKTPKEPTIDPIGVLRDTPWIDYINDLQELLSQSRRVFLFGAGCSKSAGLPLMNELTEEVLKASKGVTSQILSDIHAAFQNRAECTIEDLLSELVDHISIATRRELKNVKNVRTKIQQNEYEVVSLEAALRETKESIATIIKGDKQDRNIDAHRHFVQAIHEAPSKPQTVH